MVTPASPALHLTTVGVIRSPYQEKFAVPRQPGLVTAISAQLELLPPYNDPHCVRGLDAFSHLWLMFVFHQNGTEEWHPTVRPPRLGGNQRIGVFASRSPFRPNPIGLSVVELKGIHQQGHKIWLELGGVDLVNGTPIIDIKPYLPFVDSLPDARGGFAPEAPTLMPVKLTDEMEIRCQQIAREYPNIRDFLLQVIAQDPRPAYRKADDDDKIYGVRLLNFNVKWQVREGVAIISAITDC
ncbi:tRNA (N6-threonylcarbamoyladenosine(37)-N6)-methyltransferase TrmO [Tolumonas lignilytica]|uniref:tRNA (N6-threonylcarbamoyladenosine(37)-N6)-methyltransferase TrmO n=1 Tax=Tolumonas lignilytica TaxID=1283284 RepID=UPI0004B37539|nr:tRNA (N6-threonylcarbamoyladenosine(37)-N6)-methyltransferase TrmO [Tolumonas lignilytica]